MAKEMTAKILEEQLDQFITEYSINDVVLALARLCDRYAATTESLEGREAWNHDAELLYNAERKLGDW